MNSLWEDSVQLPSFPKLTENKKTDVLIIGGGMAGLLCAYFCKEAGIDYILAEANTICSGVTKNTTAKITSQHRLIYSRLLKEFGTDKAFLYLQANEMAIQKFCEIGGKIGCEIQRRDAYVYSCDNAAKIEKEIKIRQQLGGKAELVKTTELPFSVAGAIKVEKQAQFHPLKFAAALARGLAVYENTMVTEIKEHSAITDSAAITADNIIVATHFPFLNKHGSYFVKLYQDRSYVIALKNAQKLEGMYIDEAKRGLSFRESDNLVLLGGGSHRTGKKGGNWAELSDFAKRYYPKSDEKYRWATQDCMSLDHVPYIGRYSSALNGVYVVSGFHKWGMTGSMAAAMLIRDELCGKENDWKELFLPSRSILRPQLAVNAWESSIHLLTPTQKRCPHMGCALKWNALEQTWDCPCHGSRFEKNGNLIDNPALKNCSKDDKYIKKETK